jgi:hypothetical protein
MSHVTTKYSKSRRTGEWGDTDLCAFNDKGFILFLHNMPLKAGDLEHLQHQRQNITVAKDSTLHHRRQKHTVMTPDTGRIS